MQPATQNRPESFIDRRQAIAANHPAGCERRQFQDSRDHMSHEATELAEAVDQYKLRHRRRFITFEEFYCRKIRLDSF